MTAATYFGLSVVSAEEIPSYAKDVTAVNKTPCKSDTRANQAIRGCTDFDEQTEIDLPTRVRTYTMRGYAWLKDEEPLAAVSDFSRAIKLDPDNTTAIRGRAWAYERLFQYENAIEDWTRLIKNWPQDPERYRERAYTYHLAGQYELAVEDFTRVMELDKSNLDSRIGRALAYDALNKVPEALADFETALELNDKYSAAYVARGEMWERRGKKDKAVTDFENAYKLNSSNQKVWLALKRLGKDIHPRRRLSE